MDVSTAIGVSSFVLAGGTVVVSLVSNRDLKKNVVYKDTCEKCQKADTEGHTAIKSEITGLKEDVKGIRDEQQLQTKVLHELIGKVEALRK